MLDPVRNYIQPPRWDWSCRTPSLPPEPPPEPPPELPLMLFFYVMALNHRLLFWDPVENMSPNLTSRRQGGALLFLAQSDEGKRGGEGKRSETT